MDSSKKNYRIAIEMSMVSLARLHKFYLQGFGWSIEPPEEVQKANQFLHNIEKILIGSGYLTEGEIRARRKTFLPQSQSAAPADSLL